MFVTIKEGGRFVNIYLLILSRSVRELCTAKVYMLQTLTESSSRTEGLSEQGRLITYSNDCGCFFEYQVENKRVNGKFTGEWE